MLDETAGIDEGEALARVVYAEALAHAGIATRRTRRSARRGAAELRATGFEDPELRATFLTKVPENARTVELAAAWSWRGRRGTVRVGARGVSDRQACVDS
ncbi:MAG: hypothetical protein R3F14_34960 [Polyangiaceae bacterium]